MLIEERTSIRFDESRERFFSTRVREHMVRKGHARGIDLLRAIKKTNFDFQELLESLLTQETSFFRYPGVLRRSKSVFYPNSTLESSGRIRGRFAFGVPVVPLGKNPTPSQLPSPTLFPSLRLGMSKFSLPTSAATRLPLPNEASTPVAASQASAKSSSPPIFSRRKAANRFVPVFARWLISFR